MGDPFRSAGGTNILSGLLRSISRLTTERHALRAASEIAVSKRSESFDRAGTDFESGKIDAKSGRLRYAALMRSIGYAFPRNWNLTRAESISGTRRTTFPA